MITRVCESVCSLVRKVLPLTFDNSRSKFNVKTAVLKIFPLPLLPARPRFKIFFYQIWHSNR